MSFLKDHLERIIDTYEGHPPLAGFLRHYFRAYPKLGSRDRKALSEASFLYYRCKSFYRRESSAMKVITNGYLLCKSANAFLGKMLKPYLEEQQPHFTEPEVTTSIQSPLSPSISQQSWLRSMWQQPQLFIRIREERDRTLAMLQQHNIPYAVTFIEGNNEGGCIMLENGTAIDKLLPEEVYAVQDWASQASMYQLMEIAKNPSTVWDVCSGAGGKSILLKDKLPPFSLLASDIRETILHNLKMRFRLYGLHKTKTVVVNSADAKVVAATIGSQKFDLVLCDVPCSGSGTWSRTPEQFHFFKDEHLKKFEELQYPIVYNASKHLADGGILAYVTCSIFEQENEDVVARLLNNTNLELVQQQVINGIAQKADCMFIAVFRKV
jgi:16S rRNA (cytosine967-C5)-methyltransferase